MGAGKASKFNGFDGFGRMGSRRTHLAWFNTSGNSHGFM
jgi:hypothetical protein